MKKKALIVLSLIVVLCAGLYTAAYAKDDYELPSIPISHSFGDWVVTKEPTCTEEGKKTKYCSHCTATETAIIPALGHDFGEWTQSSPKVEPTCTTAGSEAVETRTCSRCKISENRGGEAIDVLSHQYIPAVTEPSCTEQGYTTYTCNLCGDSYVTDYTDPAGHTPGNTVTENTVDAKCTADGSYNEVVYCSKCSAELSRVNKAIPALGHNFGDWTKTAEKVEPTCTTAGSEAVETHTCSRCNFSENRGGEVIAALEHNYESVITAPKCTEKGYTTYTCSRCQDSYVSDYVDANGHTPGEKTVENTVEPTHTSGGSYDEVVYCTVCDAELSRVKVYTDPEEHTPAQEVIENTVEATCTTAGSYDKVIYCSQCSEELSRIKVNVPALNHSFGEWTKTADKIEPTCTTAGSEAVETHTCSRCKISENRGGEVIAALGHNYEEAVTEPTCTEKGYTTFTCSRCSDTYKGNYTDAKGHTPAQSVEENKINATCTENGSFDTVVYCSDCSSVLSRVSNTVNALGHSFSEWTQSSPKVEPTCTTAGAEAVETRTCSRCQLTENRGGEAINALNHDYTPVVTEPTCTKGGYTTYSCSRCDSEYVADYTDAKGHTPKAAVREKVVEATYTTEGSYEEVVYCSVCDAELSRKPKTIAKLSLPEADDEFETGGVPFGDDDSGSQQAKKIKVKTTKITKLKKGNKRFTVKWKRVKGVTGYQIRYSTKKNMKKSKKKTVKGAKKYKLTVKKLKSKKVYYVRVRAYKKVNGKVYYGKWSKIKKVRVI